MESDKVCYKCVNAFDIFVKTLKQENLYKFIKDGNYTLYILKF